MDEPSTASAAEPQAAGPKLLEPPAWAVFVAAGLVAGTVIRYEFSADAFAWAAVQVVLVGVAVYDFATRTIKNAVTVPLALLAVLLRVAFNRSDLVEILVAGAVVLLAVFALSLVLRGGLGMGDVKLAGMLGFVLGWQVVAALFLGTLAGGVAAAVLLSRSARRRATMAYGPYLALGASAAILLSHPPHLV